MVNYNNISPNIPRDSIRNTQVKAPEQACFIILHKLLFLNNYASNKMHSHEGDGPSFLVCLDANFKILIGLHQTWVCDTEEP